MEILGGGASEAEDFIREVNEGARWFNLAGRIWDTEEAGGLSRAAVASERDKMLEAMEKGEFISSKGVEAGDAVPGGQCAMAVEIEHGDMVDLKRKSVGEPIDQVEVSRIIDNPMFERNRILFTFGNGSYIRDLNKVSSGSNVQKNDVISAGILPKFTFGDMKTDDQAVKGKWGNADLCGSSKIAGSTLGVQRKGSSGCLSPEQQLSKRGPSQFVKKEVDDVGMVSNVWKKSPAVQLNLVEDISSFLREDGLVNLNLNKAKENIQKLDRALVGTPAPILCGPK
ncbi:hypothetical protein MA16_Dca027512 [Dendrobium catenatum]|uniref:Uncharacterized protein n=1 Tax=Dendrobium catenatum TaxID=906689 RepID=A0A2I0X3Y6_9ASPA|nr:hypothetical protein MA16_Dca027512 [Dendrobium catenatum]